MLVHVLGGSKWVRGSAGEAWAAGKGRRTAKDRGTFHHFLLFILAGSTEACARRDLTASHWRGDW